MTKNSKERIAFHIYPKGSYTAFCGHTFEYPMYYTNVCVEFSPWTLEDLKENLSNSVHNFNLRNWCPVCTEDRRAQLALLATVKL